MRVATEEAADHLFQQFGDPVGGMGGEAGEDVAQVGEGIDPMTVASGDHAEEGCRGVAAVDGAAIGFCCHTVLPRGGPVLLYSVARRPEVNHDENTKKKHPPRPSK
jgi:hypothetical protein